MRANLYPKLAWDGIRKNKRFYLPYILTCIGMVMMFYIIHYLAAMPTLKEMPGGDSMTMVLGFGFWVIALFAVIFLFYTNSFLMRRRQKEFGLYNMLGMGKNHLSILLLWENGILFSVSMVGGLLSGILLSKLAELFIAREVHTEQLFTDSIMFYVRKKDLDFEPVPGQYLEYDGRGYIVSDVKTDDESYTVVMGANES